MKNNNLSFFSFRKHRNKFFSYLIIVAFCLSFLAFYSPTVKADTYSAISNANTSSVDNNQGTYANMGGYDIYALNQQINFYSLTNGVLIYNFLIPNFVNASLTYSNYRTEIIQYNSTFLLGVTIAGCTTVSMSGVYVYLINVNNFSNKTVYLNSGKLQFSDTINGITLNDLVLATCNNNFYFIMSVRGNGGGDYTVIYLTYLIKILVSSSNISVLKTYYGVDTSIYGYLGIKSVDGIFLYRASIWIYSQTDINTIYVLSACYSSSTSGGGLSPNSNASYQLIKVNFVTPSASIIGSNSALYYNWVYYVGSIYLSYDGRNNYYNLLVAFPFNSSSPQEFSVDLIRFNDTGIKTYYVDDYSDYTSAISELRPIGCLTPSIFGNNSLTNGLYDFSWISQNYFTKSAGFVLENLNSSNPQWIGGGGYSNVYDLQNPFTSSSNVGGFINSFTGVCMLMIDYNNNQVCSDFSYTTNPINLLYYTITPLSLGVTGSANACTPYGVNQFLLSSQSSYTFNITIYHDGIYQTINSFSVYSTGEGTQNTVFNLNQNDLIGNNSPNSKSFTFQATYDYGAYSTNIYESYKLNIVTNNLNNIPFYFNFIWSNTLTVTGSQTGSGGSGSGGSGSGGSGSGGSGLTGLSNIFSNWSNDLLIVIFAVCCGFLTYLFAFTGLIAGIGISTLISTFIGILPVWGIGLCVVLDVTLIIMGSGLLNKKSEVNL